MRKSLLLLTLLFSLQGHVSGANAASTETTEELQPYQPRFGRDKPLVAVVGENHMTELVDFLVPFGLLGRSGVAEVLALSTREGPLQLMPALKVRAQATIAEFDQRYPQGADYLIVPAVHYSDDSTLTGFVAAQAAKGATVVGICDGVLVLGHAGLLNGRRATGHWYSRKQREADFPDARWQSGSRYVVDDHLVTTSGVSAALPVSLALVEAMAGPTKAASLAREIGLKDWSPVHDSQAFAVGPAGYLTAAANYLAFWRHETMAIPVEPGVDEVALALRADAWARSFRTKVLATGWSPLLTRHGLELLPDAPEPGLQPVPGKAVPPGLALDEALEAIAERYGVTTAAFVAAQLEYRRH
ncbi:DJ-1/PfpI family protein [Pseudomonas sp. BN102]|uniref:DJ-1/PfpI family protein n=1 Tax=Pseudomonas sp. BN102 TaxID=2567886 RepID=UPI002455D3A9|nr:DJ-1/PfpI family protein [Pseudomonas sp. BN102]MDH4611608.1 transcriptional regulator [Pseudomonas sp. BN102]